MQAQPAQELQQVDVLLVDDDRTGLMILSRSLERANFSVVTANSASEALETLNSYRPEVILADISMPGMDGFEFFRTVRANGLVDVPFIFCSGRDGALDRILGLRMGADDYLVKPIVPEEVILKVRLQITKVQYLRALKAALESKDSHSVMSGNFGGISVLDVLQTARMLGQGEYAVHFTTDDDTATVYLQNGQVLHTETGWFTGKKAFSRLLEWEKGRFNIEHKRLNDEPTMSHGLEELMLDLLTQLDEVRVLRQEIAAKGKQFFVEVDGEYLSENEIIVCDLIETTDSIEAVFDSPLLSDKEIAETWLQLLHKGTIKVES